MTRSAALQVFPEGDNQTRLVRIIDLPPDTLAGMIGANMEKAAVVFKKTLEQSTVRLFADAQ